MWFQQDGATAHTARAVLALLQQDFTGKVISKNGSVPWPPRSPDLSLCDFFLWGHLKNPVYARPERSLRTLKRRIRAAVASIPEETIRAAQNALTARLRACVRQRGGHHEGIVPYLSS